MTAIHGGLAQPSNPTESLDVFKLIGSIDCSGNPNYPAANAGHVYLVSVGGKIGGASGLDVVAGDTITCMVDDTAAGTEAAVGANWVKRSGGGVTSVFTRTGAVVAAQDDYTWAQIDKTTSSIADITTKDHSDLNLDDGTNPHGTTKNDVGLGSVANIDCTPEKLDPVWISGNDFAIVTGIKGWIQIPFNCTFTQWELTADQSGSIVIDVWKKAYADLPATNADTITNGHEPAIAAAIKAQDTDVTDWSDYTFTRGEYLYFNVDSCTTIKKVLLSLWVTRT